MNEPKSHLNVRLREFNFKGVVRYVPLKKKSPIPYKKAEKNRKRKKKICIKKGQQTSLKSIVLSTNIK